MTNKTDKTNKTVSDKSATVKYEHFVSTDNPKPKKDNKLKAPTLGQLLDSKFEDRAYLLEPWLREQESCMVYADVGVGKSMFALSAAIAVAGGGKFLGWKPAEKEGGWKVLYVDGEMHIGDIQERAELLLDAVPGVDREKARENLRFLSRQHQDPGEVFPSISEQAGTNFFLKRVELGKLDLVVLDNFSTLGDVEDENAASSFNSIQAFLLHLKTERVATILIHHSGKPQGPKKETVSFRGSSKLAATFETIIQLQRSQQTFEETSEARFTVRWEKARRGNLPIRMVAARLAPVDPKEFGGKPGVKWVYESTYASKYEMIEGLLASGTVKTQAEIAQAVGVTEPMVGKYRDKGVELGLWTKEQWKNRLRHGKAQRTKRLTRKGPDYDPSSDFGGAKKTKGKREGVNRTKPLS
jgi:hypothetical protein